MLLVWLWLEDDYDVYCSTEEFVEFVVMWKTMWSMCADYLSKGCLIISSE